MDRVGGASTIADGLKDLDAFPSPDDAPEYYNDFDETGPFVAAVGDSECAV
jgi:sulfite reductase (ferredoxin)